MALLFKPLVINMTNINEETASPSNVVELPEDIKPEAVSYTHLTLPTSDLV